TDKLDAHGLNQLQRHGTLPTVWIPPGERRDQRDLPRTRMVLVRQRTQLKNRIHAALAKYALHDLEVSDLFGAQGRDLLRQRLALPPPHTAYAPPAAPRAGRGAGPPRARVRAPDANRVQGDPGDSTPHDRARRGAHPRGRD